MIAAMKRSVAKAQIRDAVIARLEGALGVSNRLEGVVAIHDGDRIRLAPEVPAIFVIRENETVLQWGSIHVSYQYELSILALVTGDEPDEAMDEAEKWAAEGSAIVTAEPRNLGLSFVNDCKFLRSTPVSGPHTEARRVGSVDTIEITYTILPE